MVKAYVTLQGIDKVAVIDISKRVVLKYIDVDFSFILFMNNIVNKSVEGL